MSHETKSGGEEERGGKAWEGQGRAKREGGRGEGRKEGEAGREREEREKSYMLKRR